MVASLGYVVVEATDLQQWREFGTQVLGMMEAEMPEQDKLLYLRLDERPFRIAIMPSESDRFHCTGWELADQASFVSLLERLQQAGVDVERAPAELAKQRCVTEMAFCRDPAGNLQEFYHGRIYDFQQFASPVGVSGFVTGDMGLGHVVLPAQELEQCHHFYTQMCGFEQTDYMHFDFSEDPNDPGQGLHFLHCDNPRHHSLALYQGQHPAGLVHMMVEVETIDDVGFMIDRCHERGVPITATLGRHTNDRMISVYVRCPGGFEIEYGCEGWQVDWNNYIPTISKKPSFWGHKFSIPEIDTG